MATGNGRRRVVVTGLGAITPLGNSVDEMWANAIAGKSGVGPFTLADPTGYACQVSGEIRGFDPNDYIDRKDARRMARFSQFAVAAARQAVDQAGLDLSSEDTERSEERRVGKKSRSRGAAEQ